MFPTNRLVAVLTPFFGAGAAIGSSWLAKHFPGLPTPSSAELVGVEVSAFTSATAAAIKWLHGHQLWEARIGLVEQKAEKTLTIAKSIDPKIVETVEAIIKAEIGKLEARLPKTVEYHGSLKATQETSTPAQATPSNPPTTV